MDRARRTCWSVWQRWNSCWPSRGMNLSTVPASLPRMMSMPALTDRVMVDSVQLEELRRQLAESVQLVAWRDEPTEDYADVRGIFTYGHPLVDGQLMDR